MIRCLSILFLILLASSTSTANAQKKHAPIREDIPFGVKFSPRQEQPIFAVCSKQGMRVLISRDDGQTWEQTFLGTDSLEDGGWHGTFAVYGMASTNGMIGLFSGWGTPGVYIGSDDGVHWAHLGTESGKLGSVWGATAGNGLFLTSADQWRGLSSSGDQFSNWQKHSLKELLAGGKTHHIICGFGDYQGGRFIAVGDNGHAFYSEDNCSTWKHSLISGAPEKGQEEIVFGNGIFLCNYPDHVARSADGGKTWTLHEHGLQGWGKSWRGLSFVQGEFWMTAQKGSHARKSKDGITWEDLPKSTPGGRFVESATGTLINVERKRYDIKRSEDGIHWETVFNAPKEDVSWDTTFAVYEKVKTAP